MEVLQIMTAPSSTIFKKTVEIINGVTKGLEEILKSFLSKIKALKNLLQTMKG